MTMRVRPADIGDLDRVAALMSAAFDPVYGEAWSAAQVAGALPVADTWLLLGIAEARSAGFVLTRRVADEAELMLVAVDPAFRGRGYGRVLLDAAADEASHRGAATMFLEVRANNDVALALYNRAGFLTVGRRDNYYRGSRGERFDAITLRRPLSG